METTLTRSARIAAQIQAILAAESKDMQEAIAYELDLIDCGDERASALEAIESVFQANEAAIMAAYDAGCEDGDYSDVEAFFEGMDADMVEEVLLSHNVCI